jgi:hypothetical protein
MEYCWACDHMNLNIVKGISNIEYSGPLRIQDKVHVYLTVKKNTALQAEIHQY